MQHFLSFECLKSSRVKTEKYPNWFWSKPISLFWLEKEVHWNIKYWSICLYQNIFANLGCDYLISVVSYVHTDHFGPYFHNLIYNCSVRLWYHISVSNMAYLAVEDMVPQKIFATYQLSTSFVFFILIAIF